MDKPSKKKSQSKVSCVIKRPFRYKEGLPMRKKGEHKLSQDEYEFALSLDCVESGL